MSFLLKMASAAILDFRNVKCLVIGKVKRVELRHHVKFRRNRGIRVGYLFVGCTLCADNIALIMLWITETSKYLQTIWG